MKYLEELKEMLCEELEKIGKKGELSAGSLEIVHKLTDTIKNIGKIEMMEEESGGYSEEGGGGSSYARGGGRGRGRNARRDSMGRYSREGAESMGGGGRYREEEYSREGGSSYAQGGRGGSRGGNRGGGGGRGGNQGGGGGGYSRDSAKDYMMEQLEDMMEEVDSPKEREAIRRCMMALENA